MDYETIRETPLTAIGAYTVHPKRKNIAFGRWAIPVMARMMQNPDVLQKRKALQSMCDYVFDSRRVASKEFLRIVPVLKSLADDTDASVRNKLAECFAAIAATAAGRRQFEKQHFYTEVLKLLDDENEEVRKSTSEVLERIALSPFCAESLVKAGAIAKLINRIPEETEDVLVPLLQTLHICCLLDPDKGLLANGLEILMPLLKSSHPRVREKAATVFKDLTVEAKGRNQALELSALNLLLELCNDEDELVQMKALSAVMMIAIATPARFIAIEKNAINKILPLLNSSRTEIRLNSLKVMENREAHGFILPQLRLPKYKS
ncbi:uncharacterized protein LOC118194201 [Stegodyphus dumicola]|uniref:uncharacterized protein LOC118194201 n=1 Tax=Stegodyphus dumicola TaxID=202533 RepID=UPI0015AB0193|nr:uncharacterized protein LOC118194201 [Stegodyphus dumicola]